MKRKEKKRKEKKRKGKERKGEGAHSVLNPGMPPSWYQASGSVPESWFPERLT